MANMAQRKVQQILNQENGCTIEELLRLEDNCVNVCRSANPKMIEFVCERQTLQKLIHYAVLAP